PPSATGDGAPAGVNNSRARRSSAAGPPTAAPAGALVSTAVTSASGDGAALAELAGQRLDPKAGPLVHVSGVDVAGEIARDLGQAGFEIHRFALYEAREADALPDSARPALHARPPDAATFF